MIGEVAPFKEGGTDDIHVGDVVQYASASLAHQFNKTGMTAEVIGKGDRVIAVKWYGMKHLIQSIPLSDLEKVPCKFPPGTKVNLLAHGKDIGIVKRFKPRGIGGINFYDVEWPDNSIYAHREDQLVAADDTESEPQFKVGDKVSVATVSYQGKLDQPGTIEQVRLRRGRGQGKFLYDVKLPNGIVLAYSEDQLRKPVMTLDEVKQAITTVPVYEVGDRVKFSDSFKSAVSWNPAKLESHGTVVRVYSSSKLCDVMLDFDNRTYPCSPYTIVPLEDCKPEDTTFKVGDKVEVVTGPMHPLTERLRGAKYGTVIQVCSHSYQVQFSLDKSSYHFKPSELKLYAPFKVGDKVTVNPEAIKRTVGSAQKGLKYGTVIAVENRDRYRLTFSNLNGREYLFMRDDLTAYVEEPVEEAPVLKVGDKVKRAPSRAPSYLTENRLNDIGTVTSISLSKSPNYVYVRWPDLSEYRYLMSDLVKVEDTDKPEFKVGSRIADAITTKKGYIVQIDDHSVYPYLIRFDGHVGNTRRGAQHLAPKRYAKGDKVQLDHTRPQKYPNLIGVQGEVVDVLPKTVRVKFPSANPDIDCRYIYYQDIDLLPYPWEV